MHAVEMRCGRVELALRTLRPEPTISQSALSICRRRPRRILSGEEQFGQPLVDDRHARRAGLIIGSVSVRP